MRQARIPRFEQEVIDAEARKRWDGDYEKVATTSIKSFEINGVNLSSRYDKAEEYEAMIAMVEGVSPRLQMLIESIFCDSKANACYSVTLLPCSKAQAREIGEQIDVACCESSGGHNGIFIQGARGGHLDIGPNWDFDEP